ncbi:MAG: hypothetical protein KDN19_12080 [Verrucomicrobiae bacterium]|nr:hypothetical protein [Verrucomicrobiae bacterium]
MTKNVLAQEASESEAPEPEAQVIKVGESTYRLGEIVFDAKKREIRIPAVMNMREGGPIEYLMVNEKGAVHEALLTTPVRGLHLQIVFKLLRYRSGEGEIFDQFLPEEERRQRIESDEKKPRGDAVSVIIEMEKDGKIEEIPAASWILDAETGKAMTDEPWILTGSHFFEGNFLADSEGSLIGVYLDQVALLNMSRKGAENDERWGANSAATPETGKKMTLILRPAK